MKVFISWSGVRSKMLAEILHIWLPTVIQAVKPKYSPDDVRKGARWMSEIATELEASQVGLICLAPDNLAAPWIMFEAGALSKNLERSRVCPILFGLEPTDLEMPLLQFQACVFSRDEIRKLLLMINEALGEQALSAAVIEESFEVRWQKLEEQVTEVLGNTRETPEAIRSDQDILEEILELTRSLSFESVRQIMGTIERVVEP
jgi:hypothetical protein